MNWFSKFKKKSTKKRGFNGGVIGRLLGDILGGGSPTKIDFDLSALPTLRALSRDLALNDPYMAKYIDMARNNIIGKGVKLQSMAVNLNGSVDEAARNEIERAWKKAQRNLDITGTQSLTSLAKSAVSSATIDGEFILIKHLVKKELKLQLVDAMAFDTTLLSKISSTGSYIRLGVDYDRFGKPTGYFIKRDDNKDIYYHYGGANYERIDAADVIHGFIREFPNQSRGIPWGASTLTTHHQLKGYMEAAVIAARWGASKMGFWSAPAGQSFTGASEDADGHRSVDVQPGEIDEMPDGFNFQTFNPDYPHEQFGEFVKTCLRRIASGLKVSYNSLANDLENVSFSSMRSGLQEERENWCSKQQFMIDDFYRPIFEAWLKLELLAGRILVAGKPLKAVDFDKFADVEWQPRVWPWIDPLKDVKANAEAVATGQKSLSKVQRSNGEDRETIARELEIDVDRMSTIGIDITGGANLANKPTYDGNIK
ncbi:MAG: phage portal protein [Mariprofundales bacterium]